MRLENAPDWWNFELELSPQVEELMIHRGFTEVDLRLLRQAAEDIRPTATNGRWIVATVHHGDSWEVIVEPDERDRVIVVITAYRVNP
ncbi:MAG: hypothetical protein ACKO9B_08150 [Planctomycetota bacterium]